MTKAQEVTLYDVEGDDPYLTGLEIPEDAWGISVPRKYLRTPGGRAIEPRILAKLVKAARFFGESEGSPSWTSVCEYAGIQMSTLWRYKSTPLWGWLVKKTVQEEHVPRLRQQAVRVFKDALKKGDVTVARTVLERSGFFEEDEEPEVVQHHVTGSVEVSIDPRVLEDAAAAVLRRFPDLIDPEKRAAEG